MALETILKDHWRPAGMLDTEPVKASLLAQLERHRRCMRSLYILLFATALALALLAGYALVGLYRQGSNPTVAALAGAGVTVPAMLEMMRRVGREWSRTELVCDVARHSTESELQKWIEKLLGIE